MPLRLLHSVDGYALMLASASGLVRFTPRAVLASHNRRIRQYPRLLELYIRYPKGVDGMLPASDAPYLEAWKAVTSYVDRRFTQEHASDPKLKDIVRCCCIRSQPAYAPLHLPMNSKAVCPLMDGRLLHVCAHVHFQHSVRKRRTWPRPTRLWYKRNGLTNCDIWTRVRNAILLFQLCERHGTRTTDPERPELSLAVQILQNVKLLATADRLHELVAFPCSIVDFAEAREVFTTCVIALRINALCFLGYRQAPLQVIFPGVSFTSIITCKTSRSCCHLSSSSTARPSSAVLLPSCLSPALSAMVS